MSLFDPRFFHLPQNNREELLDLHRGSMREVRRSLHDIRRINTFLGGAKLTCDTALAMLKKYRLKDVTVLDHNTILDIGTGCGDIPLRLVREAKRYDIAVRVLALDISARHLQIARDDLADHHQNIHLLQGDAFALPFADKSVDLVISTLFLHHFRTPQILQLLCEFERVGRCGFVINDLVRHRVPLWFFRLTRPIFARSYITRHDGETSIRRGYTTEEMQQIVKDLSFRVEVREHFPFRMTLTHDPYTRPLRMTKRTTKKEA